MPLSHMLFDDEIESTALNYYKLYKFYVNQCKTVFSDIYSTEEKSEVCCVKS